MNHPDVEQAMLTGYPNRSYLTYEDRQWSQQSYPVIADHPVEDYFGDEIRSDDQYFTDEDGRVVLEINMKDYLVERCGAVFYEAQK